MLVKYHKNKECEDSVKILLVSVHSSYHTPNIAKEFHTKILSKISLDEDVLFLSIENPVLSQERDALVDPMAWSRTKDKFTDAFYIRTNYLTPRSPINIECSE